jgi:predicted MFS family arabinose efflux permease
MLFGLAVWFSAFLERKTPVRHHHAAVWSILAASFVSLGFAAGDDLWLILALVVMKDTAYWVLYHRYTAQIQHAAPQELMAAVVSARLALTIGILCIGEVLVGAIDTSLSIQLECYVRLAVCLAGVVLAARASQQPTQ